VFSTDPGTPAHPPGKPSLRPPALAPLPPAGKKNLIAIKDCIKFFIKEGNKALTKE